MELNKAKEKYRQKAQELLGENWDLFDFEAHWDSGVTPEEAWREMRVKLQCLVDESLKEKAMRIRAQQQAFLYKQKQEAENEANLWNKKCCEQVNSKVVEAYYEPIYRAVKKVCQGYSNLLFVEGRGGIGKSTAIKKQLVECNADYIEICGEVTEAYLYRLIYENNDKIIYMKDVVKVLNSLGSMNLLKSAFETGSGRVLTRSSYSKCQEDLPDRFVCKCKFIFDYNQISGNLRTDWDALVSRGDWIAFSLSNDDVKSIMLQIADEPWKKEVTEYIIDRFEKQNMVRLNLRTQWKAFQTYNYAIKNSYDWQKEVEADIKNMSKTRAMIYSLIGERMVRTAELKKLLLKAGIFNTIRTCDNKVAEWMFTEELIRCSEEEKNCMVKL